MKAAITMNQGDYNRIQTSLRTIADRAPNHAARTLQRAGVRIQKRARNYAPEDTGALVESIQVIKSVGDDRRVIIDIATGAEVTLPDGRTMPVEMYATIVHETYDLWIKHPSERTQAKMAAFPGKVGSFFLLNAMKDEEGTLRQDMFRAVTDVIEEEF